MNLPGYDRWKLSSPPEGNVPEMDVDDEVRLVMDIATEEYEKMTGPLMSSQSFEKWLKAKLLWDEVLDAFVEIYRDEIEERWAEEHSKESRELARADYAYEAARERELD